MVLTAYAAFSPATNSSCHRHRRISGLAEPGWACNTSANLTPATGARTTRFCRTQHHRSSARCLIARGPKPALQSRRAPDAAASTASHSNVRDDGQRPSSRNGMARSSRDDLPDGVSEIFLQTGLDRKSLICPSASAAKPISSLAAIDGFRCALPLLQMTMNRSSTAPAIFRTPACPRAHDDMAACRWCRSPFAGHRTGWDRRACRPSPPRPADPADA